MKEFNTGLPPGAEAPGGWLMLKNLFGVTAGNSGPRSKFNLTVAQIPTPTLLIYEPTTRARAARICPKVLGQKP